MIFSLNILGAPFSQQSANSAYQFAEAALSKGHSVYRVFFYHDAVHLGSTLAAVPQDEVNIGERWLDLAERHNIDLVVCVAASLRRGVLNSTEAKRYEKPASNLADPVALSGLGQLIEAGLMSDRLITFGA